MMRSHPFRGAAILLAVLLLTLLVLPAAAAEPLPAEGTEAAVTTAAVTTAAVTATEGTVTEPLPVSTLITDFLTENAASLLSGASLLLTVILTVLLRGRILPSLLSAFSALVGKTRGAVEALEQARSEEGERLSALLVRTEELFEGIRTATASAEACCAAVTAENGGREATVLLLREQSALLYELLMSANLPQYQKDRVGAAYARTEALLGECPHD